MRDLYLIKLLICKNFVLLFKSNMKEHENFYDISFNFVLHFNFC